MSLATCASNLKSVVALTVLEWNCPNLSDAAVRLSVCLASSDIATRSDISRHSSYTAATEYLYHVRQYLLCAVHIAEV